MTVIPALDIRDGKAVRLLQGDFGKETVYSENPIDIARSFCGEGAQRIHIVDLEGARSGKPVEKALIEEIIRQVASRFQVGGGIRDPETIEAYLKAGAWRVIVGTQACLDKGFTREVMSSFKESVIIGIDAVNGKIATNAWTKVTDTKVGDLIERVQAEGGEEIIYTDVSKDGTLRGPNIEGIKRILKNFQVRVIASGGVRNLEDVKELIGIKNSRLVGVIIGKAIYEGKIKLKDVLDLC